MYYEDGEPLPKRAYLVSQDYSTVPVGYAGLPQSEYIPCSISDQFLWTENRLNQRLRGIFFSPPVAYVYNPIEYAYETHSDYVRKYCNSTKDILLLGMNPGPWGMSQTGVPFGEVTLVKDWLKVQGSVHKPAREHPQRLIQGLQCPRSEVSGQRFWTFFRELCSEPEVLFRHAFVHNYCPLAFMKESAKNITPPQLKAAERRALFAACDEALLQIIHLLKVKVILGIGKFPQERALLALQSGVISNVQVFSLMHPSPINPAANKGWKEATRKALQDLGLMHFFQTELVS